MKIHEVLQLMREGKGVTQKEFTEGVLSYSYYSRVERGESYISADFLLELLKKNDFTLSEFSYIQNRFQKNEEVAFFSKIKKAFNRLNFEEINTLLEFSKKKKLESNKVIYCHGQLVLQNCIMFLSGQDNNIETIKYYLLNVPTWGYYEFELFYLTCFFLNQDALKILSGRYLVFIERYNDFLEIETEKSKFNLLLVTAFLAKKNYNLAEFYFILFRERDTNYRTLYQDEWMSLLIKILILTKNKEQDSSQKQEIYRLVKQLDHKDFNLLTNMIEKILYTI